MNVKQLIESGILEQYVSGILPDAQIKEIDDMAASHPELQQEIDAIRTSMNNYARSTGRSPSPSILEKAKLDIHSDEISTEYRSESEEINTSPKPTFDIYKIAASIVLIASLGLNGFFFAQLQNTKENQTATFQELQSLSSQFDVVTSAANMQVPLYGLDNAPQSHATVYINQQTRDVYIKIGDLPVPPSGHQYQLWADRDGHMHNIGIFHHNKELQHLAVFEGDFESLNVTLEEEGGSETATVERAYLSGKAQS